MAEPETPAIEAAPTPEHPLVARLRGTFPDAVLASHDFRGDATAIVTRDKFVTIAKWLLEDPDNSFDMLLDVTAVDYLGRTPRYEIVYHFYSIAKNHRFRLKVPLEETDTKIPSLVSLWPGANWLERETWDMYGITFEGHPNLHRIYLYEEFEGHPLRKDYPKEKRQPLIGPGSRES